MDQQAIIAGIESRAEKAGLSMAEVCRRADIHPTTFSRWKRSEKNPRPIGATLASLSKLETALGQPTPADATNGAVQPADMALPVGEAA